MTYGEPQMCPGCGRVPMGVTHACYGGAVWNRMPSPLETRVASLEAEILHCVRTDYVDGLARRVAGLESQARPLQQESGVSVGRQEGDAMPNLSNAEIARMHDVHADLVKRLRKAEQLVLDSQESEVRVIRERDAAIARADEAERERDHLREFKRVAHEALDRAGVVPFSAAKCRVVMRIDALSADCDRVAAERDAFRAALDQIARRTGNHIHVIAQAALDGSGQHQEAS